MAVTRPLVCASVRLVLNVAARGRMRIGRRDASNDSISGFSTEDCDDVVPADATALREQAFAPTEDGRSEPPSPRRRG
jgi:hypothetical protein